MFHTMKKGLYIGTSGWHYTHWMGLFYPPEIKGYYELKYFSEHFNTVENNSSFYRIAGESTYATWKRMTPSSFRFSMKLNKSITHIHKLELNDEVKETVKRILTTTNILEDKLGAIVIQLPPSFKGEHGTLNTFLAFFQKENKKRAFPLDIAIEFRNAYWFTEKTYKTLRKHNIALVAADSSRYPNVRERTADVAYIRLHGPTKLFSSKYST
jgi:uncharacterized protein YecE (DUF72 family)